MADKYHSIHTGQAIDDAITKVQNPSTTFNPEDVGKLADAKAVGELVDAEKERAEATYLPYDGYSQLARVGEADVADNLTPHSSDSGTSQNTPFILQGSGCANGEEQADTGSYCQLKEKRGNTVVVNQIIPNNNFESAAGWSSFRGTMSVANNKCTFTATSETAGSSNVGRGSVNFVNGHTVLFGAYITPSVDTTIAFYYGGASIVAINGNVQANKRTFCYGVKSTPAANTTFYIYVNSGGEHLNEGDTVVIENTFCIDLTLWFGSNDKIPTHLLNHPEDFFRYYQGDLSYNVGTLTDSNGRYLKTTGRNVFNKDATFVDGYMNRGIFIENSNCRGLWIKCNPNTTYHFRKTIGARFLAGSANKILEYGEAFSSVSNSTLANEFTYKTAPDGIYMFVWFYNASIDTGLTADEIAATVNVSLYYEGESGYDQTYPYEELANIDTGDEPLLAFDWKEPNGTIHRDTLPRIDMGTLSWVRSNNEGSWAYYMLYARVSGKAANINMINPIYITYSGGMNSIPNKAVRISVDYIYIRDDSYTDAATFKAAMSGVYLEAEADDARKTTEQGTPFAENAPIDDFGTMSFDCPNGVPQGNLIFYPVDYKAEFDTLHNITEGDMHKIALKGDNLAPTDPDTIKGVVDAYNALYAINQENMGGTLRHMLADKAEIDFANTAWVDISTLDWIYITSRDVPYFRVSISDMKNSESASVVGNVLCTKYTTSMVDAIGASGYDKIVAQGNTNNRVYIQDTAYTDVGTFKAAMKGILLAYEKATT